MATLFFAVYDANQRDKLVHLRYQALDESFSVRQKTWYYPGRDLVTAMKLYVFTGDVNTRGPLENIIIFNPAFDMLERLACSDFPGCQGPH